MLKSFHVRRNLEPEEFKRVVEFLEEAGFVLKPEETLAPPGYQTASFVPPPDQFNITSLPADCPPGMAKHIKSMSLMLAIEVSDPEPVHQAAQRMGLRVRHVDSAVEWSPRESFGVELPGNIYINIRPAKNDGAPSYAGKLDAKGKHFGVVVARFNSFITERLLESALDGLLRSGARKGDIQIVRVPGSFEIPSAARTLAETGRYGAIICLGCLLRGDTAHYDVIVNEVTRGIGQSAQETGVPHAFGVLTCDTLEQAIDRAGLKMGNKGFEAALAAVEMANLKRAVSSQQSAVSKAGHRSQVTGHRKSKTTSAAKKRKSRR